MSDGQQRRRLERTLAEHGGDPLVCALCGKELLRLGSHLRWTHGIDVVEYRARLGLAVTRPVERLTYRAMLSDRTTQRARAMQQRVGSPAAEPSAAAGERALVRNAETATRWRAELDARAQDLGYADGQQAIERTMHLSVSESARRLGVGRPTVAAMRGTRTRPATRAARLPVGLHDALAELAAAERLSTTAYLVRLVSRHVGETPTAPVPE